MPIINPCRTATETQITGPCLLLINPGEMRSLSNMARKEGARLHALFHGELIELAGQNGNCYVAGPAVGAPMAVMTLEKLIALGAEDIIIYGWCGSLTPQLTNGQLLLARWGVSDEGTSSHYPLAQSADSTPRLRGWLQDFCQHHALAHREGKVWSTDAPYRELRATIARYREQGIMAVDMEFTALCTVAAFRGVNLAALFLVSDELFHGQWQPSFHAKTFNKKSRAIVRNLCHQLSLL